MKYYIYSKSEAESSEDNAGFWGKDGFTTKDCAIVYDFLEKDLFQYSLPNSIKNDAEWVEIK